MPQSIPYPMTIEDLLVDFSTFYKKNEVYLLPTGEIESAQPGPSTYRL
jgi:hypothetical protein